MGRPRTQQFQSRKISSLGIECHSEKFQTSGDAVFFISHKFHCVKKVTKGVRKVLSRVIGRKGMS